MNICTIASDGWVDGHLARWLRKVRGSNPGATLCLILVSDNLRLLEPTHAVVGGFDKVITVSEKEATRPFYNEVRMRLCGMFGVGEVLYCDCDADILGDVSGLEGLEKDKGVLWVKSPVIRNEWSVLCQQMGYGRPEFMANNGLLYLRKNYDAEYRDGVERVGRFGTNPRVAGMMAFNAMLMAGGVEHAQVGEDWSVVWTDVERLRTAKVVQWCNEHGQSRRMELEALWRAVQ